MGRGHIPGLQADTVQQLEVVGTVAVGVGSATDQAAPAFRLAEAAVGGDAWALVGPSSDYGAGPEPTPKLVGSGSTAWYFQVDRVPVDGSRRIAGTWQAWQPPCVGENGPMILAAASSLELAAACQVAVWGPSASGFPTGVRVFVSHDRGSRFTAVGGAVPIDGVASIAMASPSIIVVAGSGSGGEQLLRSADGGKTWTVVDRLAGSAVRYLGFTTARQGVAVPDSELDGLLMTHDAGATWSAVRLCDPDGNCPP